MSNDETEGWQLDASVGAQERVNNLVSPDYRPDAELPRSLLLGVEMIVKRIEPRALGADQ